MKQSSLNRSVYSFLASFIVVGVLVSLIGAVSDQRVGPKKSVKKATKQSSSLCGTVVEKRGNQMPGPGRSLPVGRPVAREVGAFAVLTTEQVVSDETGFITDLRGTKPLQIVKSGKDGKFCFAKLPAGQYSILVSEKQGWYANQFDSSNHINPVVVKSGKTATTAIEITHQAAF